MEQKIELSSDTERYLAAQRSLILSNGDGEFVDTTDHSHELVRSVITSYMGVFLKPMLERANIK